MCAGCAPPEPGTLRQVLDLAEVALQTPMDITRPLWTATLVEGLADGRAATILHLSHAVADGVGTVEMFANIYNLERDTPIGELAPLPIPQDLSANELMKMGINRLPLKITNSVLGLLGGAVHAVTNVVRDPAATVSGVVDYALSTARVSRPVADHSPLLRRRSLASRSEAIDMVFADFHRAAKAAGGSINDAYLAGLCGGASALSRGQGHSDRQSADGGPGEPARRRRSCRRKSFCRNQSRGTGRYRRSGTADRGDPLTDDHQARGTCHGHGGYLAPFVSFLPDAVLESAAGSVVNSDVQASNVPVYPRRYLHRRGGKGAAALRTRPAAGSRDDDSAGVAGGRLRHRDHPLRPGCRRRRRLVGRLPAPGLRRDSGPRRGEGRAVAASFTAPETASSHGGAAQ